MPQQADQQQEQQGAGKPPGLMFESFQGVNTATTRPGVGDQLAYWLDGFMPLAPRNLRTLWGVGPILYSSPTGTTIVFYFFYNIAATEYVAIFLSDGSAVQVNTATGVQTTIMAAGTIITPTIPTIGCTQYGQSYLIIVAEQPNGYWVWDGATLFSAGGLSPVVTLTNVGAGYSSPPLVTATGGTGGGATFIATVANGVVTKVTVTNSGSGYLPGQTVTLVFTGGNSAGTGFVGVANMQFTGAGSGAVLQLNFALVNVVNNISVYSLVGVSISATGTGYTGAAQAIVSQPANGWDFNAAPSLSLSRSSTGAIVGVHIIPNPANPSSLYRVGAPFGPTTFPTVTVIDTGSFVVGSVTVTSPGSNYASSTTVTASGGTALAQAALSPVVVNGQITAVTVVNGGAYTTPTAPTLTATSTKTDAAGTATLMPIGIKGSAVATFSSSVWVFDGANFNFTAPGSVFDFSTADGGGSQQSNSSQLRVGYTQVIAALGFLFLIGDSSMDYIANVQTVNGVTSFKVNNADPQTGSPFPASVTSLGIEVIMANGNGIWSSASGAPFKRISELLDGVYDTVPSTDFTSNPFDGFQLSNAIATIFGKRVLMMLVPIVDPVSGEQENKLLMTLDGQGKKWWASTQDLTLTFVATQEIASTYIAWGTDGAHLFPLFHTPSSAFTKVAQSRLWDAPMGIDFTKSIVNLYAVAEFYGVSNLSYGVTIDSEEGSTAAYTGTVNSAIWQNASGVNVTWLNVALQQVQWLLSGKINVLQPTAVGQWGVLNGMTISTQCDDMAIVMAMLQPETVQYRA